MFRIPSFCTFRVGLFCLALSAAPARAETPRPPPLIEAQPEPLECPDDGPDCHTVVGEGVIPQVNVAGGGGGTVHPPAAPGNVHPASSTGGSGGNLSGDGALVIAVIAAAVLPIVVYALDDAPPAEAIGQWGDTRGQAQAWGGAVWLSGSVPPQTVAGVRGRITHGWIGVDGSIESAFNFSTYGWADAHLLVQPPPRNHIEGALAVGPQWVSQSGRLLAAVEIALPHRYVFVRDGPRELGIDLRPAVLLHSKNVDVRLDAGLTLPLFSILSLQLGGRAYSQEGNLAYAATGGLIGVL